MPIDTDGKLKICKGKNKAGEPCKNPTMKDSEFCYAHDLKKKKRREKEQRKQEERREIERMKQKKQIEYEQRKQELLSYKSKTQKIEKKIDPSVDECIRNFLKTFRNDERFESTHEFLLRPENMSMLVIIAQKMGYQFTSTNYLAFLEAEKERNERLSTKKTIKSKFINTLYTFAGYAILLMIYWIFSVGLGGLSNAWKEKKLSILALNSFYSALVWIAGCTVLWFIIKMMTSGGYETVHSHKWYYRRSDGGRGAEAGPASVRDLYEHEHGKGSWDERDDTIKRTGIYLAGALCLLPPIFRISNLMEMGLTHWSNIVALYLLFPIIPAVSIFLIAWMFVTIFKDSLTSHIK